MTTIIYTGANPVFLHIHDKAHTVCMRFVLFRYRTSIFSTILFLIDCHRWVNHIKPYVYFTGDTVCVSLSHGLSNIIQHLRAIQINVYMNRVLKIITPQMITYHTQKANCLSQENLWHDILLLHAKCGILSYDDMISAHIWCLKHVSCIIITSNCYHQLLLSCAIANYRH